MAHQPANRRLRYSQKHRGKLKQFEKTDKVTALAFELHNIDKADRGDQIQFRDVLTALQVSNFPDIDGLVTTHECESTQTTEVYWNHKGTSVHKPVSVYTNDWYVNFVQRTNIDETTQEIVPAKTMSLHLTSIAVPCPRCTSETTAIIRHHTPLILLNIQVPYYL